MSKEVGRTIRGMKATIQVMIAACQMLLGHPALQWPDEDYATFGVLADMTTACLKNNPTHKQVLVLVVAWGKFLKSVTDRVPVPELQAASLKLYTQAIDPYQKWFETKENNNAKR